MTPKEVAAIIAKSRDIQSVEIGKDLKSDAQAKRLREFVAQVQRDVRRRDVLLVAVTI